MKTQKNMYERRCEKCTQKRKPKSGESTFWLHMDSQALPHPLSNRSR